MTLDERIAGARRLLASIDKNHSPSVFASSFGAEDMVLLDLIAQHAPTIGVFTIDTGRLPEETHALMHTVRKRYGIGIARRAWLSPEHILNTRTASELQEWRAARRSA